MKKVLIAGALVLSGAALVPFISLAGPVGCSISFSPSVVPANTSQSVTGTFSAVNIPLSGSFSHTAVFNVGNNAYSLTLPNGLKCSGTVVGQ